MLTGRFVAVAALGMVAAFVSPVALGLWATLVVLAGLVDVLLAAPLRTVSVERTPTPPTRLGELTDAVLTVGNDGRRLARLTVRDRWVPSAGAGPAPTTLQLAPGRSGAVTTTLRPTRRGSRPALKVAVRSMGPLGLAGRQRSRAQPGTLLVLPAFPSRRLLPGKLARVRELEGSIVARRAGRGTEFDALRTYVPGDDATAIDWRATARSAGVVVRTFRPEQDRRVVLVLDCGRGSAARIGNEPRLDAAIDAALLLTAVITRAGDRAGLVAVDTDVRAQLPVSGARDRVPRAAAAFADLDARLVETDPTAVVAAVNRLTARRALVVLFTALDEGLRTVALATVSGLARDHTVIVAAVADPELECLPPPQEADDVYLHAAVELARRQRVDLAAALRRSGAVVVDVAPARFASAVTDAYLDLKAGGRL